ncbi:protein phosphatase CheZ [Emcibacter nanhaiensis]|uniref:Protein phosphatase CheZ n=1 Tax=Emcibacter nanhaiensis TaxID=1505037 RepID=A0A501PQB7_9PROT|nr:protein phosphatase CheZ [Emcibacter nanhaiensis]TPD61891.1 protein phosphatase CheZ [Emcibacter nanhaiensis]
MGSGLLPDHISPLVDKLRQGDHHPVSLPDVAALTEVLMRSTESYFRSIDLTLYQECQSLADYINDAKAEIASLSPEHSDSAQIPRAGQELEAIVQQTESATNTIMESAERIMSAETDDAEAFQATVHDAVMQIFEACSFQDITGQRISKVVRTLEYVEDRIDRLINILGIQEDDVAKAARDEEEIDENKALLNGPALEGEGIDQTEIDALLNGEATEEAAVEAEEEPPVQEELDADDIDALFAEDAPAADATPEPEPEAVPEELNADDIDALFAEDAPAADPAPEPAPAPVAAKPAVKKTPKVFAKKVYEEDPEAALDAKATGKTSQEDIDALFG